jgi:serine/threonine protein kinase/Flp pilus assembly protein TadD
MKQHDNDRESRVNAAIAEFLQAVDSGQTPDRAAFLRQHAELVPELEAFLTDQDRLQELCQTPLPSLPTTPDSSAGTSIGPRARMPSPETVDDGPVEPWPESTLVQVGRYRVEDEIARGGMGVVYRAHDPDLGRSLAVKVLQERHMGDQETARRFLDEAQVCGQLQHPGVPPIHELGTLPDGRPFFAMKLVRGQTLASLLCDRHEFKPRAESSEPAGIEDSARGLDLPRFLHIFEQVCQTVAYAHSRGILHRDLKPANVMVGAFAEVQVMDWGLAKVIHPASPGGGVGRPAPSTDVTPASTVFTTRAGLPDSATQAGTILGTLAYMPPEQARGQVDFLDERADVFALGAALCEILTGQPPYTAAEREARLRQAAMGDLAEARERLATCGADAELVGLCLACLEFEPSKRPPDAGAVAEAVAAYRAGVAERLRRAEVEQAAAQARAAEERKRRRVVLALVATVLAAVMLGGGGWLWVRYEREAQAANTARQEAEMDRERESRAVEAARKEAEIDRDATAALHEAALLRAQNHYDKALAAVRKAEGLLAGGGSKALRKQVDQARADLDVFAAIEKARLQRAEWKSDPNADLYWQHRQDTAGAAVLYHNAFKAYGIDVLALDETEAVARIAKRSTRTALVAALDDWSQLAPKAADQQRLRRIAQAADPDPNGIPAQMRQALAKGDRDALGRLATKAIAEVDKLPPAAVVALASELSQAQGIKLLRVGQQQYPSDFWINFELALRLKAMHPPQLDEAIRFLTVALALRQPPDFVVCNNLGILLLRQHRLEEAEVAFRKTTSLRPDYADGWFNLGVALRHQGKLDQARSALWSALKEQPGHTLAEHYFFAVLKESNHLSKAVSDLRKASEAVNGATPVARSYTYYLLGRALTEQGKPEEAVKVFRKAIAIYSDANLAYYRLGVALIQLGERQEGVATLRKAIEMLQNDPDTLDDLGNVLVALGEWSLAAAVCRRAVELKPYLVTARINLGVSLMQSDEADLPAAEKHLRAATRLEPDNALAQQNLGVALMRQQRWAEAEKALRRSIELDASQANFHCDLGTVLRELGRSREAVAAFRRAVKLAPDFADAHHELGLALLDQAAFSEALPPLQRALALLPDRHPSRSRFQQPVSLCERLIQLDRDLPSVLKGKLIPTSAAERIQFAAFCAQYKRRHAAAVRLYAAAFTADQKLADNPKVPHRYNAACSAALAGAGQGEDAGKLDEDERARLRKQALTWLRADLAAWGKLLDQQPDKGQGGTDFKSVLQKTMQYWQQDADFASVRGDALAKLLEAEQKDWRKLWDDVAALLKRAQGEK